jgi:hypothetical protein
VHVCLSASSCRSASMYLFLYSHLSVTCMLICLPACFCVSYAIICKQYCTANICCPPVKAAERL